VTERADLRRLPAEFAARALALAAGEFAPVVPRAAATVILLRDAEHEPGVEVYLLRRVVSMAFAAGMYVFPGGSVDDRDAELPDTAWAGPPPAVWADLLNADDALARALVCAAVRETFEESGVLLAGPTATEVVADTRAAYWEADRQALLDRSLSLAELLEGRRLVLRSDLLRAWAHWITPEAEPRRYDTRFFVAAMPSGQRTRDVGGESDRVAWAPAAEALRARARGDVGLMLPTAVTLEELCPYADVAAVLAAAANRNLRPRLPRVVVQNGEPRIVLDEPGS
jgi:8-oxo-dGTP pyrophosphatase MutT (NUDIX family)